MSVLIKGIELPEKVQVLELHSDGKVFTRKGYLVGEAVELPEKHGDLIDRGKLLRDIEKYHVSDGKFQHWTEVQQAVIEAEDGE